MASTAPRTAPAPEPAAPALLTPAQAAYALNVDEKTMTRWARGGLVWCTRTPGGHRRFAEPEITAIARGAGPRQTEAILASFGLTRKAEDA